MLAFRTLRVWFSDDLICFSFRGHSPLTPAYLRKVVRPPHKPTPHHDSVFYLVLAAMGFRGMGVMGGGVERGKGGVERWGGRKVGEGVERLGGGGHKEG